MIQDDDGNAYKVNGQRLKLFLDHNKALGEEIDVIDLVDHALISKKSHIGQKGRWTHYSYAISSPTCQPEKAGAQPWSTEHGLAPMRPSFGARPP